MSDHIPAKSSPAFRALIALQALTLVAVVAGQPGTPAAEATVPTLPNAAAQRNTMIDLLQRNVDQSKATGDAVDNRLKQMDERLKAIDSKLTSIEKVVVETSADGKDRP